ncbi:MAG: hypothetical protein D3906_08350 [Candidatus Electrothrix sp. AUS1_2]|nr:hypothetical protein [Candidatus Electrothrix sp. AUS1_2]
MKNSEVADLDEKTMLQSSVRNLYYENLYYEKMDNEDFSECSACIATIIAIAAVLTIITVAALVVALALICIGGTGKACIDSVAVVTAFIFASFVVIFCVVIAGATTIGVKSCETENLWSTGPAPCS